jgi:hypothetical protein
MFCNQGWRALACASAAHHEHVLFSVPDMAIMRRMVLLYLFTIPDLCPACEVRLGYPIVLDKVIERGDFFALNGCEKRCHWYHNDLSCPHICATKQMPQVVWEFGIP